MKVLSKIACGVGALTLAATAVAATKVTTVGPLKNENYKFMILANAGELQTDNNTCKLTLTGGVQTVSYQAIVPNRDAGTLPIATFAKLWGPNRTFATTPPNAFVLAKTSANGNVDSFKPLVVTLKGITYKSGDSVTFDCGLPSPLDSSVGTDAKFISPVVIVDMSSGGIEG